MPSRVHEQDARRRSHALYGPGRRMKPTTASAVPPSNPRPPIATDGSAGDRRGRAGTAAAAGPSGIVQYSPSVAHSDSSGTEPGSALAPYIDQGREQDRQREWRRHRDEHPARPVAWLPGHDEYPHEPPRAGRRPARRRRRVRPLRVRSPRGRSISSRRPAHPGVRRGRRRSRPRRPRRGIGDLERDRGHRWRRRTPRGSRGRRDVRGRASRRRPPPLAGTAPETWCPRPERSRPRGPPDRIEPVGDALQSGAVPGRVGVEPRPSSCTVNSS